MGGYVRNVEFKVQFDGRDVAVALRPLQRADLFRLRGFVGKDPELAAGDMLQAYAERLPEYVLTADVVDAAGQPVEVGEWTASAYFTELVAAIMTEHMRRAVPGNP